MLTSEDLAALYNYLEENKQRNRINDINNMSKAGTHFDPLTDQEPNTSGTILDNRLAEERPLVVRHLEPPSSSPAIKRDRRSVPQTSETSTDTERDIVIVQRKGIK